MIPTGFICKQQIRLYDFDFIKSVLADTTDEINEQFMDEYTLSGFALGESPEYHDQGFIPDNEVFLAETHGDKIYRYELCNGVHFKQQTCGGGFVIDKHYGTWLELWEQLQTGTASGSESDSDSEDSDSNDYYIRPTTPKSGSNKSGTQA